MLRERSSGDVSELDRRDSGCGETEPDPAFRSRSSRRALSFLPAAESVSSEKGCVEALEHTIISLGDAILDPPSLGEVRDLGPVFVGIGIGTEGAAGPVTDGVPGGAVAVLGVGVALLPVHGGQQVERRARSARRVLSREMFTGMKGNGA